MSKQIAYMNLTAKIIREISNLFPILKVKFYSLSTQQANVVLPHNTKDWKNYTRIFINVVFLYWDFHATNLGVRNQVMMRKFRIFAPSILESPSQCFPKLMSMEMMPHLCINF